MKSQCCHRDCKDEEERVSAQANDACSIKVAGAFTVVSSDEVMNWHFAGCQEPAFLLLLQEHRAQNTCHCANSFRPGPHTVTVMLNCHCHR